MRWPKCIIIVLVFIIFFAEFPGLTLEDGQEAVDDSKVVVSDKSKDDITYTTPKIKEGGVYFYDTFDDPEIFKERWILSSAKKQEAEEEISKYNGRWDVEEARADALKGDLGLALKSKAKHHAISAKVQKLFHFVDKPFIMQYEVNFQNGQECGGAYIKLLTAVKDMDLNNFHDKTPYSIMFGPDKCGSDHKIHFIFRHKNPKNGTFTEKHCKRSDGKLEDIFKDKRSHLFTLVIKPDNTYEILVDQISVNSGSLLEDFTPPVNPPREIDDPTDHKPEDWDEREKIPDPNSQKPEDWDEEAPRQIPDPSSKKPDDWLDDEPETIPDPNAEKPSDWDDEMDGEWEPPLISNPKCEKVGCGEWKPAMIDNPKYKGKWRPPMIANPNYRGKWKPRRIANPDYFEDKKPFRMSSIGAIGLELWSMSENILFDNILIADNKVLADRIASETWDLKRRKADRDAEGIFKRIVHYTNKHPWLWAVYVVVIGLPLVLFFVFCCTPSEEKKQKQKLADAKKTDAYLPDDEYTFPSDKVQSTAPVIKEPEEIPVKAEEKTPLLQAVNSAKEEPVAVVKEEQKITAVEEPKVTKEEEEEEEEEEECEESSSSSSEEECPPKKKKC